MRRDKPRLVSHAAMAESLAQASLWQKKAQDLGLVMLIIPVRWTLGVEELLKAGGNLLALLTEYRMDGQRNWTEDLEQAVWRLSRALEAAVQK